MLTYIDTQFHKLQSALRRQGGKVKAVRGASVVRPAFSSPAIDEGFFEVPTYLRRKAARLARRDADDGTRMMGYGERYTRAFYESQGLRVREHAGRLEILNGEDQVVATDYGREAA